LQNKIAATESFYNKVIPPPPDESFAIKIKEIDHFFADDDFKKATLYANDIFDVELGSDAISVNSVAFEVGGRPSKSHTSVSSKRLEKHTLNFEDVDNHVKKVLVRHFKYLHGFEMAANGITRRNYENNYLIDLYSFYCILSI